jgi:NADH-quinone oxidoreductase subunit N
MIYLALEMVSIPSYILTGYIKNKQIPLEASLKYIIYGAMSSGIMLYSFTYIYGLTNEITLNGIARVIYTSQIPAQFILFLIILMMVGIGFKLSLVPFHFWTPDIYQGAPTPITAHLSVASKAAGFALLLRMFFSAFSAISEGGRIAIGAPWINLIAIFAVITMTLGNVVALVQKDIKRLLAYSTIAHAGYMIMGLVTLNEEGISAILFYLISYLIMNLGAFYTATALYHSIGSYNIEDYKGLWKNKPIAVIAMAFFMLSLVGIPPFIGFFAKFILFAAVINAGWIWLAVIAVINSVVSLYYYVYVIKVMVVDYPDKQPQSITIPKLAYSLVIILALINLIAGPAFKPFYQFSKNSAKICNANSQCMSKYL